MREYYKILNVSEDASENDIKKAYRKLAMKNHPDKGGDAEQFKKINEAYSVLSDNEKRQLYNKHGKEGLDGNHTNSNASDIFSQFFRTDFSHSSPEQKTQDKYIDLEISLEDICKGVTKNFNIQRKVLDHSKVNICKTCNGTGIQVKIRQLGIGIITQQQRTCTMCKGTGSFATNDAFDLKSEKIEINICKGCPEETLFTFPEMTNEEPGKSSGNLIFKIKYKKHKLFTVLQNSIDLITDIKINLLESLSGFKRIIEHPSGDKLTIGSNRIIKPGKYAIFNKGIQLRTIKKGNMYINIHVNYPEQIYKHETTLSTILGQDRKQIEGEFLEIIQVPKFEPTDISMYTKSQNYSNNQNGCTQS
jgi:DnaJ homolog subfamily A member 2